MSRIWMIVCLLTLWGTALAEEPTSRDLPKGAVVLSFQLKVELGGRTTEVAPKLAVLDGKSADMTIWSDEGEDEYLKLAATPKLLDDKRVALDLFVRSRLAGKEIERKMTMVALLGNEASFQVTDAKNREKLQLSVLPTVVK